MTISPWVDLVLSADIEDSVLRVSKELSASAVARDHEGSNPREEADLLKSAGLTGITLQSFAPGLEGAAERLRTDRRWQIALSIVRRLARADLSTSALLGYNYMTLWRIETAGDTAVFRNALKDTLNSGAIWGGTNNPKGPTARLWRVDGGYRITGRKTFATGSQSADFVVVGERLEGEERRLNFALPADTPGLGHGDDWDGFGARRSASGSILFDNVFVPENAVFRTLDTVRQENEVTRSSGSLGFQILFINMLVGAAQGAIELALAYLGERGGKYDSPDESYIPEILGRAVAELNAAAALADRANESFAQLALDKYEKRLPPLTRAKLADSILQAKIVADRVGLDVSSRVLEATGARSATRQQGFDRIWRDIRVYTLHDPVALRAREVGWVWLRAQDPASHGELEAFHNL